MSTQCPLNGRPNQSVRKLMESLLERSEQEHKFSLLQKTRVQVISSEEVSVASLI